MCLTGKDGRLHAMLSCWIKALRGIMPLMNSIIVIRLKAFELYEDYRRMDSRAELRLKVVSSCLFFLSLFPDSTRRSMERVP